MEYEDDNTLKPEVKDDHCVQQQQPQHLIPSQQVHAQHVIHQSAPNSQVQGVPAGTLTIATKATADLVQVPHKPQYIQHKISKSSVIPQRSIHIHAPHQVVPHPPATIVTVVPPPKDNSPITEQVNAPTTVMDSVTVNNRAIPNSGVKVEVEPALRVPSPATTIECVDADHNNRNHTVYIVNSNNAACQKSLDTICEAIRHLEGDHMFPVDEQHPPIEEEIITEETYAIEDHSSSASFHHSQQVGEIGQLTLQMVPPEPQEVPLELTTTHRMDHHHQQQHHHASTTCSQDNVTISQASSSTTVSSNMLQVRPGVIVVKHT